MLSIIVPTFNSQKTIKRCLNSILKLKHINYEIIVVDDGSTDNTSTIIEYYDKQYNKIHGYINSHHNTAYERNYGLIKSKGNLICFVDSDDYISPSSLEMVLEHSNNVDLIITNLKTNNKIKRVKDSKILTIKQFLNSTYPIYGNNLIHSIGNKLYNAKMIKKYHIKFPNFQGMGEDLIFNLKCISHSFDNIKMLNITYYNVIINKHSTTYTFEYNALKHRFLALKYIFSLFHKYNIYNPLKNELITRAIYSSLLNTFKQTGPRNKQKYINDLYNKINNNVLLPQNYNNCTLKYKILIFIFKHFKSHILYLFIILINEINNLNK